MEEKKYTIRIPPCPAYDVEGTESWLSDLAEEGLLLAEDGFFCGFAYFNKAEPQHMQYRLEAAQRNPSMWADHGGWPEDEALALSEDYGWEYVTNRGDFHIYRSARPAVRELNTDPEVQALALKAVQRRRRDAVFNALFWGFLYPLLVMGGGFWLFFLNMGSWFALGCLVVDLWCFADSLAAAIHLSRLRKKLLKGGAIDHRKDWRRRAALYHGRKAAKLLAILVLVWCGLQVWSDYMLEKDQIPLQDYTGDPPFATIADLAPEGEYSLDLIGFSNTVRQWSDPLAPVNFDWAEIARIELPDGSQLRGGAYIDYHETIHPRLAADIAREYHRLDRLENMKGSLFFGNDYKRLPLPQLDADYAVAYTGRSMSPCLILQRGCRVARITFYQTSQSYTMPLEEWSAVMAAFLRE